MGASMTYRAFKILCLLFIIKYTYLGRLISFLFYNADAKQDKYAKMIMFVFSGRL